MRRSPLRRYSPLRRVSVRREGELIEYRVRSALFLLEHPWCQYWLAIHGIEEEVAIRDHGWVRLPDSGRRVRVPRATTVHHRNKRRGRTLLDERFWMAVSFAGHRAIESDRRKARENGFLEPF